ncbi:hypothetical protein ACJ72_02549 [Emergomyces africanus]|uniref:Uncharacterized protein n=1 Tax=Emergomyces africanus TaxID=1955775 RepID=A0A1B7P238_9EURO|nr:hypothetical protein ACJ72_02549 [Emergomyces africanus]
MRIDRRANKMDLESIATFSHGTADAGIVSMDSDYVSAWGVFNQHNTLGTDNGPSSVTRECFLRLCRRCLGAIGGTRSE